MHKHRAVFLLMAALVAVASAQEKGSDSKAAGRPGSEYSGMYSFLKEGEFLQITLEKDAVTGYISRMGDSDSDGGVFLDQFFAKADDAYYVLRGTLKELSTNPDKTVSARAREVVFKLLAQPDDSDQASQAKPKKTH